MIIQNFTEATTCKLIFDSRDYKPESFIVFDDRWLPIDIDNSIFNCKFTTN